MTVETAVKVGGEEKCGVDMRSSCEDLSPASGVGGGGCASGCECNVGGVDGKDDYVFVNGSDATSDDHGEAELSELNADVREGGDGDRSEMCNGVNGTKVDDNAVVVHCTESNVEKNEILGEDECNGGEFVKENGGLFKDGDSNDNEGEIVVKECDLEVVEDSEVKSKADGNEVKADEESVIEEGDDCNGLADGIGSSSLDDHDKSNNGSDSLQNGSAVVESDTCDKNNNEGEDVVKEHYLAVVDDGELNSKDEVKADEELIIQDRDDCNGLVDGIGSPSLGDHDNSNDNGCDSLQNRSTGVEIELKVPGGEIEEQRRAEIEKQSNEFEKSEEVGKSEVIEDNVDHHIDEVSGSEMVEDDVNPDVDESLATESEPIDGVVEELKLIEADVVHQSQGNDHIDIQQSDGETKASDSGGGEVLLADDAVAEKSADNGELGPVETEAEVKEQGDLDHLGTRGTQVESLDSETTVCELQQGDENQDASDVMPEPEECLEPQDIEESGADKERTRTLIASELDETRAKSMEEADNIHCDKLDKSEDDHELDMIHEEGNEEVEQSLECSVQGATPQEQVVGDTGVADITDGDLSSEDVINLSKVTTIEETVNPSMPNSADEVVLDDENIDLTDVVLGSDAIVPESSNDSGKCSTSEGVPHDTDMIEEQEVVDDGSDVGEPSSLSNLKNHSDESLYSSNKTCYSEGILTFGSFVCQTKPNGVFTNFTNLNAQITAEGSLASTGLSDAEVQIAIDGVPASSLEESRVSTSMSDPKAHIVTDDVSASPTDESHVSPNLSDAEAHIIKDGTRMDESQASTNLSNAEAQIIRDGVSASPMDESRVSTNLSDAEAQVVKDGVFRWLIKVPRLDNVEYEQIKKLQMELAKKTQDRDAFWKTHHERMDAFREAKAKFHAVRAEKEAKAKLMAAKKREIDSAQSLLKLARDGNTVERIDSQIRNLEQRIQHETLNFAEEKKLIREIKQLNLQREQLAADTQGQQEVQKAVNRKVETEEQLKVLRKEMDALGGDFRRALDSLKAAERKYEEESKLKQKLETEYSSLAKIRDETYDQIRTLKKQAYEKNKPCYDYRDAKEAIKNLKAGEEESLEQLCVNQVENFMELWNNNDEFRKEYIRSNMRSTLRRFNTLDARDLGIDEKKPVLEESSDNGTSLAKVNSVATALTSEREFPSIVKKQKEGSSKKVRDMKNTNALAKNSGETTSNNGLAEPSGRLEAEEKEEVRKLTKEEEELARKAEQKRREEEAERLKEQRRLEEKAKAQEALERKKRMAEKAQARAKFKAEKEAEEKKKEKEKRAMKKEKKRGLTSDPTEVQSAQVPESSSETRELEVTEKPITAAKKSQKPAPLLYTKQVKTIKSIPAPPAPLRNRGKRRVPQWAWWLVLAILIVLIFPLGNIDVVGNIKPYISGAFK